MHKRNVSASKRSYAYFIAGSLFCCGLMLLFLLGPLDDRSRSKSLMTVVASQSLPEPPCGNTYGSSGDREEIQEAMLSGNENAVKGAIQQAKETRGNQVGCAETCVTYTLDNTSSSSPSLNDVAARWNSIHAPSLSNYAYSCPTIGRLWGPGALGGYYSRLAGFSADLTKLADIGNMYEAQQYKAAYVSSVTKPEGLFGYNVVPLGNACYPFGQNYGSDGGVDPCGNPIPTPSPTPIDPIGKLCDLDPSICVTYSGGPLSGKTFLIADIIPEENVYDGGMAFDHGWAGVSMVEAKFQQPSQVLKNKFVEAARLAGDWAITEPPNTNHNYTAKLVWLLSEVYGLTGDNKYKVALMDKFRRNLKYGVLMDQDSNGYVDDMQPNQSFSGLTNVSQRPGRMWDGHNARPQYQAMNTWAVVEAYVVLRDHGDTAEAAEIRPYAIAMLNNVAWEINNLGIPNGGKTQIPYALLLGLWKIAGPESESHTDWENAVAILWNGTPTVSGMGTSPGDDTVNVGLYLLYKAGVPYVPLRRRKEIYQPAATTVLDGSVSSGNLSSLYTDDNDFLVLGGSADPTISFAFQTTQTEITKLRISARSKDSVSGISRKLYIWNKTTNQWNPIGTDTVGTTETIGTVSQTNPSGFPQYVDNGVLRFALMHDGTSMHSMSVDQVELGINE